MQNGGNFNFDPVIYTNSLISGFIGSLGSVDTAKFDWRLISFQKKKIKSALGIEMAFFE